MPGGDRSFWNSGEVRIMTTVPVRAVGRWRRRVPVALAAVALVVVGVGAPSATAFPVPALTYSAHVAGAGWQASVTSGQTAGTTGQARAMEALRISGVPLRYRAHVQGIGWQAWVPAGSTAGTTGRGLRMEALQVRPATGSPFRVEYRAHVEGIGWQPWTSDGGTAGTTGRALRIEAVQIRLVPAASLSYSAHVAGRGWLPPVTDGGTAGTTGQARQMEALRISGTSLTYRAHVEGVGWQAWVPAGSTAGTTGRGLRMEALQVRTPTSSPFRVEYRAHVGGIGWQPWTRDGGTAGTTGRGLRVEAVQIRLVPKGLRFTATADNGLGSTAKDLFAGAGRSSADLGLVIGDLSYAGAGSEPTYCSMVNTRVRVPTLIVAGNHEDTTAGHPTIGNFARCLPARMGYKGSYAKDYYVDRGPVRFILISPGIALSTGTRTYRNGTADAAWLTTAIRDARAAGRWVVVGMHKPCLTLGSHGCASDPDVSNLLIREHVDLVLSGHDHVYSRTHQLKGTTSAPVVVDRDGSFARGAGTVFTIVGNGGHEPRTVAPRTTAWAAASGTNSPGGLTFGFGAVDATYSSLTFRLSRTSGGTLADSFTIRR